MITTGEMDVPDAELAKKLAYVNERMPKICNVMDIPDHEVIIVRVPKNNGNRYGDKYEDCYCMKLGQPVHGLPKPHFGSHEEMQLKVMSGIMMAAHMAGMVRPALNIAATNTKVRGTLYFDSIDDLVAAVDAAANGVESPAISGRATLRLLDRRAQPPTTDRGK